MPGQGEPENLPGSLQDSAGSTGLGTGGPAPLFLSASPGAGSRPAAESFETRCPLASGNLRAPICQVTFSLAAHYFPKWEGGTKPLRTTPLPLPGLDPLGVHCSACPASLMQVCKDGFIKVRGGTLASCSFPLSLQPCAALCFLVTPERLVDL